MTDLNHWESLAVLLPLSRNISSLSLDREGLLKVLGFFHASGTEKLGKPLLPSLEMSCWSQLGRAAACPLLFPIWG